MIRNMKKQYFLGLTVVVLLTLFNVSPTFAHNGEYHTTVAEAVTHESVPKTGLFSFLKNLFSFQKDTLPANVITSTQVSPAKISTSEQKVNDQEIRQLTAKLNSIDASIRTQTTILENSVLNKLVPSKIVSKNTIGKAIEDKNKLLATLSEKSPKDAIAFIEKNKLVGKKQVVGTPVTKISKKDITVDINHFDYDKSDKADYFGTYVDGRVVRTMFSEQFRGLGGEYKIAELSGYQFGNNILITQMSGFTQITQPNTTIQTRSTSDADYNVLVLLVDYLDSNPPQQLTDAQTAHDILFNGDLHDFFYEQSYGKMNIVGDVYGWYTLQSNAEGTYCNPMKTANNGNFGPFDNQELLNYVVADTIQVVSYDHILIISNCKNVTGGGFASDFKYQTTNVSLSGWQEIGFNSLDQTVPLAVVKTSNANASLHTMAHELGHKLYNGYYMHANGKDCGDQIFALSDCINVEYGNFFDAMGSWQAFSNHFRAVFKLALGWIEPEDKLEITESGRYWLTPIERDIDNNHGRYKVAIIKPPYLNFTPYIIEYRSGFGYDSNMFSSSLVNNIEGIFIYKNEGIDNNTTMVEARLLDMNPTANPWDLDIHDVALNWGTGESYIDEDLGIEIIPLYSVPDFSVMFDVIYTPVSCERRQPLINYVLTPRDPPFTGDIASYKVSFGAYNEDNLVCESSVFSGSASAGPWQANRPYLSATNFIQTSFSIPARSNGGLGFFYIRVPNETVPGQYPVTISATNQNSGLSMTETIPIIVN